MLRWWDLRSQHSPLHMKIPFTSALVFGLLSACSQAPPSPDTGIDASDAAEEAASSPCNRNWCGKTVSIPPNSGPISYDDCGHTCTCEVDDGGEVTQDCQAGSCPCP